MMKFEAYLKDKKFIPTTVKSYCLKIKDFTLWLKENNLTISDIRYNDILRYIKYKSLSGCSKRYVNQLLNIIRHYLDYKIKTGEIKQNPAKNLIVRGVTRTIPNDLLIQSELDEIYNTYPTSSLTDKRNKAILGLLVYQGIRIHELTKLEPGNLKLRQGKIYIPSGHKSNSRTLELKPFQVFELMEYQTQIRPKILELSGKQSDKLFISAGTGNTLNNSISKLMKNIRKQYPKIINPGQIRASVISNWLKQYNLRQVQYMAGHKYVSSTERYQSHNLEDLQRELEKYHPLR